ncbi:MAG TPA: beta-ketoacyl-[acyl-carrier-protein] synthase family protein [Thermoanaerobaculia bacterium]|nr:beta-ketoacyl-[acyl-carrier-protein] synthase family protein [Thermoanaerobaculia bacterium]
MVPAADFRAERRRVAVTGIGVVTPVGSGRETFWRALLAGESGITPVSSFDTSRFKVKLGAEVRGFDPAPWCERLDPKEVGRASQMAIAAARMALADAGLDAASLDAERVGVAMGTTSGEPLEIEIFNDALRGEGRDALDGALATRYPCHRIPGQIAAELGFAGVNVMLPSACAAGNYAVAFARDALATRRADVMLAGGADAFSRITYTGFARLGAITTDRCAPFDRERKGMVPGEGAGVLVLEPLDAARARGARVYAEVVGYGLSCDAHHMTASHPEGEGPARAMAMALADAGLLPEQVDYISAHGTGTPTNDRLETLAVKRAFGGAASRVPMSSVKSMLGHTMGAASALEAAVCCLAIADGWLPPTINYEHPDPDCDLDYVPNVARQAPVRVAMNNAYAFGGANASVLFAAAES